MPRLYAQKRRAGTAPKHEKGKIRKVHADHRLAVPIAERHRAGHPCQDQTLGEVYARKRQLPSPLQRIGGAPGGDKALLRNADAHRRAWRVKHEPAGVKPPLRYKESRVRSKAEKHRLPAGILHQIAHLNASLPQRIPDAVCKRKGVAGARPFVGRKKEGTRRLRPLLQLQLGHRHKAMARERVGLPAQRVHAVREPAHAGEQVRRATRPVRRVTLPQIFPAAPSPDGLHLAAQRRNLNSQALVLQSNHRASFSSPFLSGFVCNPRRRSQTCRPMFHVARSSAARAFACSGPSTPAARNTPARRARAEQSIQPYRPMTAPSMALPAFRCGSFLTIAAKALQPVSSFHITILWQGEARLEGARQACVFPRM